MDVSVSNVHVEENDQLFPWEQNIIENHIHSTDSTSQGVQDHDQFSIFIKEEEPNFDALTCQSKYNDTQSTNSNNIKISNKNEDHDHIDVNYDIINTGLLNKEHTPLSLQHITNINVPAMLHGQATINYEDNEMIFDRRTCKKELQDSVLKIIDVHNKVEIQNDDVDKVKGQNGEVQRDDVDKVKFQNGEVHENEIEKVAVQKIMLKEVIQNHAQWKDKQIKSTEIMKEVNIETEMNSDKESHEVNEQNILPSNVTKNNISSGTCYIDPKRERYRCDICLKIFKFKTCFKNHRSNVCWKQCPMCFKKFDNSNDFKKHYIMHTQNYQHKCLICFKRFRDEDEVKKHHCEHDEKSNKPKCDVCWKAFSSKDSLTKHVQLMHGTSDQRITTDYTCHICSNDFKSLYSLKSHIDIIHKKIVSFECEVCNKNYPRRSSLNRHMRLHTGNYPFMCDVCGKGFNSGSRFKTHMLKHKGLKSFKCEYCNKGFYSNCNLNQHLVVHETGGQYMCHICGKEFKRPFNLKLHMATHTGEKKYQCDTCGQIFSRSDNLMTHSRKHSGLKPYQCHICSKHFSRGDNLKSHIKKMHKTEN